MSDFRNALDRFRGAVRQEGETAETPGLRAILERDRGSPSVRLLMWASAAAAVLVLSAIPVYKNGQERRREAEEEKADAVLLERLNASLPRSVPPAMAPLMNWVPVKTEAPGEKQ